MKTAIIIIITVFTTLFCVFSATADYCDLTQEEYEKRMEKNFSRGLELGYAQGKQEAMKITGKEKRMAATLPARNTEAGSHDDVWQVYRNRMFPDRAGRTADTARDQVLHCRSKQSRTGSCADSAVHCVPKLGTDCRGNALLCPDDTTPPHRRFGKVVTEWHLLSLNGSPVLCIMRIETKIPVRKRAGICVRRITMQAFAESFYKSRAWRECRDAYAASVGGLCEPCLARGLHTAGVIVHHKVHLTPDNIHDPAVSLCWDNLQLVCRDCHAALHGGKRCRINADGSVSARW